MRNQKPSWKVNIPPLEDMQASVTYTLTLNKSIRRPTIMEDIRDYLKIIRSYIHAYALYKVVPELSCSGKLHYHGVIIFNTDESLYNFYYNVSKMGCAIEIDTIKDMKKWHAYMYKQNRFKFIYEQSLQPYTLSSKGFPTISIDDIETAKPPPK